MKNTGHLEIWDKNFIWHPFTQMSSFLKETPLIIKEAKGVILKDIHGKEYIDGVSSLWCNIHGHKKKEIDKAIKAQLKKVAHSTLLGASNIPSITLAKKLVDIAPKGLTKVFYSDNGSTAVEVALKMVFQYWSALGHTEKKKFLALQYAYHGDTLGAVAVGGIEQFHDIYRPLTFACSATTPIKSYSSPPLPLPSRGRGFEFNSATTQTESPLPPKADGRGKGEGDTPNSCPHSNREGKMYGNTNVLFAPSPYCYRCPLEKETCISTPLCHSERSEESEEFESTYTPPPFPLPSRERDLVNTQGTSLPLPCLKEMERILVQNHNEIAALIIEPLVQGAGGMIVHPTGYLKGVRELCDKYNVLLIADEVLTGFGRTGKMFACEHEGVVPDIMCISKGLTAGYLPLAATLVKEDIYNAFLGDQGKTFFHGHTYTGNPLACAAALASLGVFEKEAVLKNLQPKIEFLEDKLKDFYNLEHVGDVRQCGLIVGIELVKDRQTKEPYTPEEKIGHKVILEARKRGALLRPLGNVIVIMPPLSITMKQLERLMDVAWNSIKSVGSKQ